MTLFFIFSHPPICIIRHSLGSYQQKGEKHLTMGLYWQVWRLRSSGGTTPNRLFCGSLSDDRLPRHQYSVRILFVVSLSFITVELLKNTFCIFTRISMGLSICMNAKINNGCVLPPHGYVHDTIGSGSCDSNLWGYVLDFSNGHDLDVGHVGSEWRILYDL